MSKEIKDYLHLYLGCEIGNLSGQRVGFLEMVDIKYKEIRIIGSTVTRGLWPIDEIKPILRPLSDMTKEETNEMPKSSMHISHLPEEGIFYSPELFKYLLSKHFDLFGLIQEGLAIDKTKKQ